MDHDPKAYLFDIQQACEQISEFTHGMGFEEYIRNAMGKGGCRAKVFSDW
jgi:uncharacterized protein with HEPN domain